MNQKRHSQKRPWYRLDDSNLRCPHCKGLEDHRNGSCPRKLSKQIEDAKNMDVSTDKDDTGKRQCYRCGDCYLSFMDIQNLEDHKKKDCQGKLVITTSQLASYQSCMDVWKCTMDNKILSLDSFMKAIFECSNAIARYSIAKKLNVLSMFIGKLLIVLCTIASPEEQLSLSDVVSLSYEQIKAASEKENQAVKSVRQAVRKLKNVAYISELAKTKEHLAFSEVVEAFKVPELLKYSSLEFLNQEMMKFRTIQEKDPDLSELHKGLTELTSSISLCWK